MKKVFAIVAAALFLLGLLIFRPVPITTEEKCKTVSGTVNRIFEGVGNDVVFALEEIDGHFYINRGLETGLKLEDLQRTLTGRQVTLKYPHYWTLLDPRSQTRHLAKVEYEGEVIYDETVK